MSKIRITYIREDNFRKYIDNLDKAPRQTIVYKNYKDLQDAMNEFRKCFPNGRITTAEFIEENHIDRETLWDKYFEMVYDSTSVPEIDYDELERRFYDDLDHGNIDKLIYNLENIRHDCGVLIDLIQECVKEGE